MSEYAGPVPGQTVSVEVRMVKKMHNGYVVEVYNVEMGHAQFTIKQLEDYDEVKEP
jgi:hypothetical protein